MAITIRIKKGVNGFCTPYLDFHFDGNRWYEFMPLLKYKVMPQTLAERQDTKDKKELVNRILRERELKLAMNEYDIKTKYNNKQEFFEYLDNYIENYPNTGDAKAYKAMRKKLKAFAGKPKLYAYEIDEAFLRRFVKFLEKSLSYETPLTYFKKLKKVLKLATRENMFKINPAQDVQIKKYKTQEKHVLTLDEIPLLIKAKCPNNQVKNSFLFALYTGLRFVDVNNLTWKEISKTAVNIRQSKTDVPVTIPINPTMFEFLGERKNAHEKVFNLPSHTGCLKSIRKWVLNAGIEKHVTFHVARHSFGTNLVAEGNDISTTMRLLGHTSLKHTIRYVRPNEDLKQNAINSLFKNKI